HRLRRRRGDKPQRDLVRPVRAPRDRALGEPAHLQHGPHRGGRGLGRCAGPGGAGPLPADDHPRGPRGLRRPRGAAETGRGPRRARAARRVAARRGPAGGHPLPWRRLELPGGAGHRAPALRRRAEPGRRPARRAAGGRAPLPRPRRRLASLRGQAFTSIQSGRWRDRPGWRSQTSKPDPVAGPVAALRAVSAAVAGCERSGDAPASRAAAPAPAPPAFVGAATCASCHEGIAAAFRESDHARAMQVADPATVLGDFGGARFTHRDVTSTFLRRDGKFAVRTEGPDGEPADFDVAYTVRVRPLPPYLVAFPGGRVQALAMAPVTR